MVLEMSKIKDVERIVELMSQIANGEQPLTDELFKAEAEGNSDLLRIFGGLFILQEELEFNRRRADQVSYLRSARATMVSINHLINSPLTVLMMSTSNLAEGQIIDAAELAAIKNAVDSIAGYVAELRKIENAEHIDFVNYRGDTEMLDMGPTDSKVKGK